MKKSFVFFGVLLGLFLIFIGIFNPDKKQKLSDDIVALVDNHPILKSDLDLALKALSMNKDNQITSEQIQLVKDRLIDEQLLLQRGIDLDLHQTSNPIRKLIVNSMIDNQEMISYDYCDISVAVSGPKGLMVPVVRNAELLSFSGIEKEISHLAIKAREGKITVDDMTGGTFTISNGGVFGSMLSTPIINPPQSGILGMHNIIKRPVVIDDKVVVRPMMYLALSYDHRIIDGRESVGFLVAIKEALESPVELIMDGDLSLIHI